MPSPRPAARYDLQALRPPDPDGGNDAVDPIAWQSLHAWCLAGSGPGTRPWWTPHGRPAIETRLALARLSGPRPAALEQLATQLMLERDGSLQLRACAGESARLALRLKTLVNERLWWRARQARDPWDSGWLRDTPVGLQAALRFMPRRPTLLVAQGLAAEALTAVLQSLLLRQQDFAQPVRMLVLGELPLAASLPASMPITHVTLD